MSQIDKRISTIVRQLSDLSRDGWAYARRPDYLPLEAELRRLRGQQSRRKRRA